MAGGRREFLERWGLGAVVLAYTVFSLLGGLIPDAFVSAATRVGIFQALVLVCLYSILSDVWSPRSATGHTSFAEFGGGLQAFLAGRRVRRLDIYALSTQTFLAHLLTDSERSVGSVRLVLPSDEAVETFYRSPATNCVDDGERAADLIKRQIQDSVLFWNGEVAAGRIKSVVVRRLNAFPTRYLAILNGDRIFGGDYLIGGNRHSHGLQLGTVFVLDDAKEMAINTQQWFEAVWNAAAAP